MSIDYSKYPPDWKQRRARILERAGNKCEFCGVPNKARGYRDEIGQFHEVKVSYRNPKRVKIFKVVLTIAHLDHDEENHEVEDTRLRALCQRCHLAITGSNGGTVRTRSGARGRYSEGVAEKRPT